MVTYSETAKQELEDILYGLVTWKKHPLDFEHAKQYVADIRQDADTICTKLYHQNCSFELHKQYGEKVHVYSRSSQTKWYIIYNWQSLNRVAFVNKIINNYLTVN